jgi:hypothetical protein
VNVSRLAVLLVVAALPGCMSVPIATIAKLSSFDETQFTQLDPTALRVRVSMPAEFVLDPDATRLVTTVTFGETKRHDDFRLERVSLRPSSRKGGLFSADVPVASYELRLVPASVAAFRAMQVLAKPGNVKGLDMNVQVSLKDAPQGAQELRVWVDILRDPAEGWVTLIDGGTIEIDKTTKYGEGK